MKSIMMRCRVCGKYTLGRDKCPHCGNLLKNPHPPKFSPEDRFSNYRLLMRLISSQLDIPDDIKDKILKNLRS